MTWNDKHLRLSPKEITTFLHNAQLASCEIVDSQRVPALHYYKTQLLEALKDLKAAPEELVCVLVSAAWDVYEGIEKKK